MRRKGSELSQLYAASQKVNNCADNNGKGKTR